MGQNYDTLTPQTGINKIDQANVKAINDITGPKGTHKMRFRVFDEKLKYRVDFSLQYNPESLQVTVQTPAVSPFDRTLTPQWISPGSNDETDLGLFETNISMGIMFENMISKYDIEKSLNWLLKYHMHWFLVFIGKRIYKGPLVNSSWDIQRFDPKFNYWMVKLNLSWHFYENWDEETINQFNLGQTSTFSSDLKNGTQAGQNKLAKTSNKLPNKYPSTVPFGINSKTGKLK
jgi:hypothetical protein